MSIDGTVTRIPDDRRPTSDLAFSDRSHGLLLAHGALWIGTRERLPEHVLIRRDARGHAECRMFNDWRRLAARGRRGNGGEVVPPIEALVNRRAERAEDDDVSA